MPPYRAGDIALGFAHTEQEIYGETMGHFPRRVRDIPMRDVTKLRRHARVAKLGSASQTEPLKSGSFKDHLTVGPHALGLVPAASFLRTTVEVPALWVACGGH
ncbi:hypothetical protein [Deinococcus humi]|uniref:Uncharacterized protein n=1 Tax=Deinococcus humi TaxID=662880 RepID=A0A7W8NI06_9DEIO|nr:hypothetical protein [Deinococcus humi]MBB5364577.1 hypothetical protein [Deinococcus humi]GGO38259.1 hypothetical protein GCM10008949_44550 [Deinococcus humi]